MKLALYGGTFDPVHHGHLIMARDAMELLSLDRVVFLPAAISPHKLHRAPASAEIRRAMVEAAIAGYGKKEVSSPFDTAGPLTEALLMANLAIRGYDIRTPKASGEGYDYPGRSVKLLWDNDNMRVTNFDAVNQFVKRDYRKGWSLGV